MTRRLAALTIGAAVSCSSPHHLAPSPLNDTSATPTKTSTPATTPRPTPTRASRSRQATADPRTGTGSLLKHPSRQPVAPVGSHPFKSGTAGTGPLLSSTAYCETGLMANGHRTHRGAVAANRWPLGTRLHVTDSPYGPGIFTVEDRIGWGSDLDFAMPGDCEGARTWGRHPVHAQVLP